MIQKSRHYRKFQPEHPTLPHCNNKSTPAIRPKQRGLLRQNISPKPPGCWSKGMSSTVPRYRISFLQQSSSWSSQVPRKQILKAHKQKALLDQQIHIPKRSSPERPIPPSPKSLKKPLEADTL